MMQAYMPTPTFMIPGSAPGTIFMNAVASRARVQNMTMVRYPLALAVSFMSFSTLLKYLPMKYAMKHMCPMAKNPICAMKLSHDPM